MDRKRLQKLIIPLLLEQLLTVSVGMIDTFMVSTVGEAAVSGVALVDNINLLVIQVMAAFAAGGIVVISQYIGNKNEKMSLKSCAQLEVLMVLFSVAAMFIYLFMGRLILKGLFGKVEADVMNAAVIYMMISGISFVFWGFYTAGAAILRCQEDTKTAMKVSLSMNCVNVLLNAVFVFGLHMGVLGVAVATLISKALAGILMKVILSSKKNRFRIIDKKQYLISFEVLRHILSMGIPSGIENGMFHVGKLIVASMIATLETNAIAANSISYQIIEFPNIWGGAIGMVLVIIVGQEIGAGNKLMATKNTKELLKYAYVGDWISKAVLFILAPFIVRLFPLSDAACDTAVLVLRCFCVAAILIWPLSYTLPNALRGAGDVKFSMMISIISMWLGRVAVSYVLVVMFHMGVLGVWLGMFADWYIRGISYLLRFCSKKWLDKHIFAGD